MRRQNFGNSRESFTVTVMGEELYIIISPEDVLAVYKDTKALDFDPIIREIIADFGVRNKPLDKVSDRGSNDKHWMDLSHTNFRLQMHPGNKLETLQSAFLYNIEQQLC
jgi:hypothetical protein